MFSTRPAKTVAMAEDGTDPEAPKPRPASSCTEILLLSNRKEASEQFAKAARAEKAYRTKKKATLARANYNETKEHFREAFSHFKLAFKGLFSSIKNVTYLFSERSEIKRQEAEKKKREKNLERKRKLEEQLAKAQVDDHGEEEEEGEKKTEA
ncbi:hypothetical protein FHETE_4208 [Fusarium heterosporum]|uniref:Uncharacterized protein n=1 Tax=Fusarium heterosporum TaxID=42747 RepID=A0A8H5WUY5_FUSHE|nr:hypothetical protein FHETE_4208 [Fusarium heterosporum]